MQTDRVRLRPAVSVHHDGDHVRFFDGHRAVTLSGSGEAVERLASAGRLLAQAHSASELSDALAISTHQTSDMVTAMTVLDLVEPDDPALDSLSSDERSVLAFATVLGGSSLSASDSLERLRRRRVVVIGRGAGDLAELCSASGLTTSWSAHDLPADFEPSRDLAVPVVTVGEDKHALTRWNERFIASGAPWLPIAPFDGAGALVGPLMVPGETCCYECFLSRRASNVAFGERFRELWLDAPGVGAPPALDRWVQSVAVLLVLRWLVQANPAVTSRVFRIDPVTMRLDNAYVFPVPRCPGCSAAAWQPLPAPWELE